MSLNPGVSVALTLLFAWAAVGHLVQALRPDRTDSRIADLLHVVMSLAMLAMPWSWGMAVAPPMLLAIVFGLGTAYFGTLLLGGDRLVGPDPRCGGGRRLQLGYHAVMMGSMVVMALMMRTMHTGHGGGEHAMHGMDMGSSASGAAMHLAPGWTVTSWILMGFFTVATGVLVADAARRRRRTGALLTSSLLLTMSAGMALAFVPA